MYHDIDRPAKNDPLAKIGTNTKDLCKWQAWSIDRSRSRVLPLYRLEGSAEWRDGLGWRSNVPVMVRQNTCKREPSKT